MITVDFFIALLIGILAGLGLGSGGLFFLYLTFIRDVAQKEAQGLNLLFFVFALAGSLLVHLLRRAVPPRLMGVILLAGLPGCIVGSLLIHYLPVAFLKKIFGLLLTATGVWTLWEKSSWQRKRKKRE